MASKQKIAIIGTGAIAGLYILSKNSGDSQKTTFGGGGSGAGILGFTETKKAVGESLPASTPLSAPSLPDVKIYESALPSPSFATSDAGTSKKSTSTADANFLAGKYQINPSTGGGSSTSGIYTNPAKNQPANIFNPSVPKYTDSLGQGVSVAVPKKTTTAPKKTWWSAPAKTIIRITNPTRWFR